MCSSRTKNWFQIQPLLGFWGELLSVSTGLVWFLWDLEFGFEIFLEFVTVCEGDLSLAWDLGFEREAGLGLSAVLDLIGTEEFDLCNFDLGSASS